MHKAYIFDWDGTLVDTLDLLHAAYNHVFETYGLPVWSREQAMANIRMPAKTFFPETFKDKADEAVGVYYNYVRDNHLNHIKAYAGIKDVLQSLSDSGCRLGVVSNKRHDLLNLEVDYMMWRPLFASVIGAGYAANDKPHPDPLLKCIEELGLNVANDDIYFVGDTKTDIECADAAAVKSVFVTYGMGKADENVRAKPSHIIDDLSEITKF